MDNRKLMLLVGALVVAAVTAFMARSLIMGASAPQSAALPVPAAGPALPDGPQVLVATKALPVGTILDMTSFKYQPWPRELVGNAYYEKKDGFDPKTLQGTVVRINISAGQPLTQGALVKPGDRGFLAAALTPGMRAVTFPVSQVSSVAGFVFPGDHIDLLLTQSVSGGGDGPPLQATETIMRNLRVLATDQRTDNVTDETGKTVVKTFSTVTIESTPSIAEKIAVAQNLGKLSIALRPISDSASDLDAAIASGDVKIPNDPKAEKDVLDKLGSEPTAGKGSFSTGADVSRFQRSTVPGKTSVNVAPGTPLPAAPGPDAAGYPGAGPAKPAGPVVRIARGNNVTEVTVGGNK